MVISNNETRNKNILTKGLGEGYVGKIRLNTDTESTEGDSEYSYKIIRNVDEIPLVLGEKDIRYKGNLVFVHSHTISPIK